MKEFDPIHTAENDKVVVQIPVEKKKVAIPLRVLPRGTTLWEVNLATGEVLPARIIHRDLIPTKIKISGKIEQVVKQELSRTEVHSSYEFREGGYDYQIAINAENALRKTERMIRRKGYHPAWMER